MASLSLFPYNISLKIKSFDIGQLFKVCKYIESLCKICGASSFSMTFLPLKKKHLSLIRSPHIHKKSRTQLCYKRHKALLCFKLSNDRALKEALYFFKTSYLPGTELSVNIVEKAYISPKF